MFCLLDQTTIPVNAILGVKLAKGAHPIDSFDNLYFMAIARIHQVKYGPFFEHSSQLYSIAAHVQSWAKVNKGLFEMYQASQQHASRVSIVFTHACYRRLKFWANAWSYNICLWGV